MDKQVDTTDEKRQSLDSLQEEEPGSRRERARRAYEERLYRYMMGMPPGPKWKQAIAFFSEYGYAARFFRRRLGLATPIDALDRRVLEQIIFPGYLADRAIRRVLFVGCDNYTAHYEREFFARREYWTIEPNPKMRRFGAKRRHVIAPLEDLAKHFSDRFLDLIICNGVYGWGLNTAVQCEAAFSQCYTCLKPGGHLLIGWDDIPTHKDRASVLLPDVSSLSRFDKFHFPALDTWQYVTDTPYRHTYEFYRKP
jgi:SAM-dependent methyltransferase